MKIDSRDNSLLRHARAVRDGKVPEQIFVEGLRLCEELLRSKLPIDAVIYSEELARKPSAAGIVERLETVAERTASVSEKLLASISYTKTPQGIVVLAQRPQMDEASFKTAQSESPLLIVMHLINNPVNVGAILRTAEAAGVTGAIATADTADPFSPKALRGAMGSAFRLPVWTGASYMEVMAWCSQRNIHTVCADAEAPKLFTDIDWRQPSALIVGPESSGLSPEEISAADDAVRIHMQASVESLNVAVATGIVLYEAARQRGPVTDSSLPLRAKS
ncbi:MAG: methyltransferase, TrmH family [Blastocatellia bacterium]|jgi:TrmH family RNA methyltransferase|nr:methyltransferase, TrmH family [Blastocatellia bacterium]